MNAEENLILIGIPSIFFLPFLAAVAERRLTAIIRLRISTPLLQPFYEIMKLFGRETLLPKGGSLAVLLAAPPAAFAAMVLASSVLLNSLVAGGLSFSDAINIFYLFLILPFAIITAAAASGNPLSRLGVSAAVSRMIAEELPFIAVLTALFLRSAAGASLVAPAVFSLSGVLAFIITIISFGAKSAGIASAGREDNLLIEYSGPPLALFTLSRWFLIGLLPVFALLLFSVPVAGFGWIVKYSLVFVFICLVKEIFLRIGPDLAVKMLLYPVNILALSMLLLAAAGL